MAGEIVMPFSTAFGVEVPTSLDEPSCFSFSLSPKRGAQYSLISDGLVNSGLLRECWADRRNRHIVTLTAIRVRNKSVSQL
jgi:hypothetical protein